MQSPKFLSPKIATPASSLASPAVLAARRHTRYIQAESALRTAVEVSSSETSPEELQIRALEKATAMLSEQANEAQASAKKLRACLAKKEESGLTPEEVKSMQREAWLEERRGAVRQDQSTHTQNILTQLCSPITETPPPLVESPSAMSKTEANLQKFLQRSPTRVGFSARKTASSPALAQRRKTISQVQPMQLRPSALELALRSPVELNPRRNSLDGQYMRRQSVSTDVTCVSENSSERTAVVPRLKLATNRNLKPPISSPSPLSPGPGGSVRIETPAQRPRPRDTLLAEVGNVPLPDYVVDLLEDLVASSLDVTLPALSPSPLAVRAPPYPYGAPPDSPRRVSLSMPDFSRVDLDEPPLPLPPPPLEPRYRPPSLIIDRLLNRSDATSTSLSMSASPSPPYSHASSASWSPAPSPVPAPSRRRSGTASSHRRASTTQSLYVPPQSRFSSLRLSTPSLVAVPEADVAHAGTCPARPQTSMSAYSGRVLDSPEAGLDREYGSGAGHGRGHGEDDDEDARGDGDGVRRRFSMASFRRRRFNSEGNVRAAADEREELHDAQSVRQAFPGDADGGVFARVRRRLTGRRLK